MHCANAYFLPAVRGLNNHRIGTLFVSTIRLTLLVDLKSDRVPTGADLDPTTTGISYQKSA